MMGDRSELGGEPAPVWAGLRGAPSDYLDEDESVLTQIERRKL